MIKKYNIGDLVNLRSGSPVMTIINDKLELIDGELSFNEAYECSYFEESYEVRRVFPQSSLESHGKLRKLHHRTMEYKSYG
jgi:uncharacterized protein YodC (DUF2158 family)